MRRTDREIKDFCEMLDIMRKCDVCRICMNDEDIPYIVPLNFGLGVSGNNVTLYFHSATEGKKLELLRRNNNVAFEMDCEHALVSDPQRGYCTMDYASIIGNGVVEFIEDGEQKLAALRAIVDKYHPEGFVFDNAAVPKTAVYKLTVLHMTAKRHKKRV